MNRVAIVGGGITGLAAAHRLYELGADCEIDLLESTSGWGGVLQTEQLESCLVEHSADMFTSLDTAALELCERIGFRDQLIGTNETNQRAFVVQQSRLVPVPRGLNLMTPSDLNAIEETELLSEAGKKRFLAEEAVPAKGDMSDESLQSFAVRRFGEEAYQKIIQPLVGGIYTADPTRLSLKATLPQYLQMEAEHGSIIKAAQQRAINSKESATSGARYHLFLAPRNGMASLVAALQSRLSGIGLRTGQNVNQITRVADGHWDVKFSDGRSEEYHSVIVTCPAEQASKILGAVAPAVSRKLSQIPHASSAIVVHAFDRGQIRHSLDGFGFVVPIVEGRKILAGSFSSNKFSGRASEQQILIRTFIGGGCQPELLEHSDEQLAAWALEELADLIGVSGQPQLDKVIRWNHCMPQYHLGHLDLVDAIESEVDAIDGLEIAGKAFRGVGIPACVRSGEAAAERLLSQLSRKGM